MTRRRERSAGYSAVPADWLPVANKLPIRCPMCQDGAKPDWWEIGEVLDADANLVGREVSVIRRFECGAALFCLSSSPGQFSIGSENFGEHPLHRWREWLRAENAAESERRARFAVIPIVTLAS